MIDFHLRLPDELHRRINDASHDARLSMNQWIIGVLDITTAEEHK